jgi:hypothetical protein
VLEYRDRPGDRTTPHAHPDSVMVTLTGFRRRLIDGDRSVDVDLAPGLVRWLAAQSHAGENIGDSETRVILIELKDASAREPTETRRSGRRTPEPQFAGRDAGPPGRPGLAVTARLHGG